MTPFSESLGFLLKVSLLLAHPPLDGNSWFLLMYPYPECKTVVDCQDCQRKHGILADFNEFSQ